MGVRGDNVIMCDRKGVIYKGRDRPRPVEVGACGRDRHAHAGRGAGGRGRLPRPVGCRTRSSRRWSRRWPRSRSSSPWPIPIRRSRRRTRRRRGPMRSSPPAGRTIPNQVNNVLGFPFIFRGALDVRATAINDEMKIAAAEALAELAREPVPEEVAAAYGGRAAKLRPRLHHPRAVRPAADGGRCLCGRGSGGARAVSRSSRSPNMEAYRQELRGAAQSDCRR